MSWSSRRAVSALAVVTLLGTLSLVGFALGQRVILPPVMPIVPGGPGVPGGPAVMPARTAFDLGSLLLPKDEDLKERVEAASDNIKVAIRADRAKNAVESRRAWEKACTTLQQLLQRPEDVFVPLTRLDGEGRESSVYVSVKKEALRLLGTMTKEGRDFYEATYGPGAQTAVTQSKTNNDFLRMSDTFAKFLYTDAGREAGIWLGTYMLDRAEYQGASRFYQQLISRNSFTGLKDKTLLKAAYAFNQAGDRPNRDLVMAELQRREFKFGGAEPRTVADIRDTFDKMVVSISQQSANDSPIYRGTTGRSAMLPGGTPFLEPAWAKKPLSTVEATRQHLRTSEDSTRASAAPILSANVPVTATVTARDGKRVSQLIYRTWSGLQAVDMKDGKLSWDFKSDWSLDEVLGSTGTSRDANKVNAYTNWLAAFNQVPSGAQPHSRPQLLVENSVLGTLSADSKYVYAVEDLAIPAPANQADPRFVGGGIQRVVADALAHNKLLAYEMAKDGRIKWEVGGTDSKHPLGETYFLAAPLPLNGKLYVLGEKQQELRLISLDPATGKVLGIQPLATVKDIKMATDPLRRTQACHLAYGEGIMVVPTNAGAVFGVDTVSNSLLWAYPYREASDAPVPAAGGPIGMPGRGFPGRPGGPTGYGSLVSNWQVTAPAVTAGKVVFTAPDARNIHCVSIRDGSRIWHAAREEDDLYLGGVYGNKVVIVGRKRTRALSLANGQMVWQIDHGEPSGQGAASNASGDILYYLPIRSSLATKEPEILSINVDKGIIHAHTRSRKKEIPGNLIFFEGQVVSQNQHEIVAYPQLEVQLARLAKEVDAAPTNPDKLTERGDYLLDKGDLDNAITDLRKALANKPGDATKAKARGKLFEAFTELFQRDFSKAERYLDEFEEMCKIDLGTTVGAERTALVAAARTRRANFLCLVGKGRESQNRLVDAFKRYLELGEEAKPDELIQVVDEPSVKAAPDVWSQGRIEAMVKRSADAKQMAALEALIKARWDKIKASAKTDELRKFVSLFGSLFGVGREARFALADKLMEESDLNSLLEAEQQLSVLRSSDEDSVAARAVEALARLNTRKGLLEDAAYYYRVLGEKYPEVKVDGKTGKQYMDELPADKRFLPFLGAGARFSIRGKVKLDYEEKKGVFATSFSYNLKNLGEPLPYFVTNRLAVKSDWMAPLEITDTATGEKRLRQLDRTNFQGIVGLYPQSQKTRFGYQTLGHTVVLQLGHRVFGIDPLGKEPRVLWSKNLSQLPGSDTNPPSWSVPQLDARDGSVTLTYTDGSVMRLGSGMGPLAGGVVCLLRRDSMTAIDPVTGRELWVRTDISPNSYVFGDGQNVYVVGLSKTGAAAGTRAFRAYDGVSLKIKDFSPEFDGRQRIVGRTIYTRETPPGGATTVKLYDVAEGKAIWSEKFAPGSLVLETENPELAGAVDTATGTVRIVSLKERREVMTGKLDDLKHAQGAERATLVADPDYVFVAFKMPDDPNKVQGAVMSCLQPSLGLASAPVNGMVYAFRRPTGKRAWYSEVINAHLTLTGAEDAPALHFTSRYNQVNVGAGFRTANMVQMAFSRAKHNERLWWEDRSLPMGMNFHEYTVDQRTGKMELIGGQMKVTLTSRPLDVPKP